MVNDSCPICGNELGEPYRVDGFRIKRVGQSMDRPEVFVRRLIGSVDVCERCVAGLESEDGRIPAWMMAEVGPVELTVRKLVARKPVPLTVEQPRQEARRREDTPRPLHEVVVSGVPE